jgi:hypothetical protein
MSGQNQQISLNFTKNLKWWQATIMIVSILIAAGYAASQGVNLSMNIDLQAKLQGLIDRIDIPVNSSLSGLQKPYDYIVSLVDTYYCMQNGTTGKLDWFSTNKTAVEAAAIGNATVTGWILLKGCTIDTSLTLGNTTIVEANAGEINYYGANGLWFSGQNRTDTLSGPDQPGNYIVDMTSNGVFRAKNCTTGQFDFSSINASIVIQNALNNCPNGGIVHLKAVTYPTWTLGQSYNHGGGWLYPISISLVNNTILEGEGYGTVLRAQTNATVVYGYNLYNVTLRDLRIDGNRTGIPLVSWASGRNDHHNANDIWVDDAKSCNFQNLWCQNAGRSGLHCDGYVDGIIQNCIASGCGYDAIHMGYSVTNMGLMNSTITRCRVYGLNDTRAAIETGSGCFNAHVFDCRLDGTGSSNTVGIDIGGSSTLGYVECASDLLTNFQNAGIYLQPEGVECDLHDSTFSSCNDGITTYANDTNIHHNNFLGTIRYSIFIRSGAYNTQVGCNFFKDCPNTGINEASGASAATISFNTFRNVTTILYKGGTNMVVFGNIGFVTENYVSGTNTTATTVVINHGLAAAATYVFCSFNITGSVSYTYTWTSTATQITVTLTVTSGSLPAAWQCWAEVKYTP